MLVRKVLIDVYQAVQIMSWNLAAILSIFETQFRINMSLSLNLTINF